MQGFATKDKKIFYYSWTFSAFIGLQKGELNEENSILISFNELEIISGYLALRIQLQDNQPDKNNEDSES